MASTTALQSAPQEPEAKRHENISGSSTLEQVSQSDGGLFARVFGGVGGKPPVDGAALFFGSTTLSRAVNNGLRVVTLKRAQQTYGNRFMQQAIAGIQRKPVASRVIQRQCACGGTCEKCSASVTDPAWLGAEGLHTES